MFAGKGQFFQNAYEEFVSAQEEAVAQLNVQRARNSRFAELLARVLKNFDEARLGFDALLLEPVQRLPRYLLLLKGIHTPFYYVCYSLEMMLWLIWQGYFEFSMYCEYSCAQSTTRTWRWAIRIAMTPKVCSLLSTNIF